MFSYAGFTMFFGHGTMAIPCVLDMHQFNTIFLDMHFGNNMIANHVTFDLVNIMNMVIIQYHYIYHILWNYHLIL